MKICALILALLIACVSLMPHFVEYLHSKTYTEQVAAAPRGELLRIMAGNFKQVIAAGYILNVLTYFGGRSELAMKEKDIGFDYNAMTLALNSALIVDPYNMDGYYFAQASLVWDTGQVEMANLFLEHGMRYRTWDFQLPFFAGFNYGYFLKNYSKAAYYYARAAELSGIPLFAQLTSRYLHEAGQTEHAIAYLSVMARSSRNEAVRNSFVLRLNALKSVRLIEIARDQYQERYGVMPDSIVRLVSSGFLKEIPDDPYGGTFYLERNGQVRTTSSFAHAGVRRNSR